MGHQHQHHKWWSIYQLSILLCIPILLSNCQTCQSQVDDIKSATVTSMASFTYSTSTGAVWQINVAGNKTPIVPDDGVQKQKLSWSPDRQWLAYVAREFSHNHITNNITSTSTSVIADNSERAEKVVDSVYDVKETLMIVTAAGREHQQLTEPSRAIQYTWLDKQTIDLRSTQQLSSGDSRQQWERYQIDVSTGRITPMKQELWSTPPPIVVSPNGQWQLLFETVDEKTYIHLCDAGENIITTIYQGTASQDMVTQWSPDSRYVFYTVYVFYGAQDIYTYDLMTEKTQRVTDFSEWEDSFMIWNPHWSPSGKQIFFVLDIEHTSQPCLVDIPAPHTRCFDVLLKSHRFVWSVDGRYLAFLAAKENNSTDIYIIDTGTEILTNLTQDGDSVVDWTSP